MAYNLVRIVMASAAAAEKLDTSRMSISAAGCLLVRWFLTATN